MEFLKPMIVSSQVPNLDLQPSEIHFTLIFIDFLDRVCKHGLPKKEDVFDFAALCVLKYERKRKAQKMKELQENIKKRQHAFDLPGKLTRYRSITTF